MSVFPIMTTMRSSLKRLRKGAQCTLENDILKSFLSSIKLDKVYRALNFFHMTDVSFFIHVLLLTLFIFAALVQ